MVSIKGVTCQERRSLQEPEAGESSREHEPRNAFFAGRGDTRCFGTQDTKTLLFPDVAGGCQNPDTEDICIAGPPDVERS